MEMNAILVPYRFTSAQLAARYSGKINQLVGEQFLRYQAILGTKWDDLPEEDRLIAIDIFQAVLDDLASESIIGNDNRLAMMQKAWDEDRRMLGILKAKVYSLEKK